MFSHEHEVEMTRRYRKDHDLFGVETSEMNGDFDELTDEDLLNYRYPAFSDIEVLGLRGLYLGNFVRWDPVAQHLRMVDEFGYRGRELGRTFDIYDHADCFSYSSVLDILKQFKFGYGKVRDQACREIRHGRLTREHAAALVSWYETQEPSNMSLFAEWLGVSEESLRYVLNRHRNPALWEEMEPNIWRRRKHTGEAHEIADIGGIPESTPPLPYDQPGLDREMTEEPCAYITVGKGVRQPSPTVKSDMLQGYL